MGTHFHHTDKNKRLEAANYIVSLLDQDRRTPVIFGGDLNLKPFVGYNEDHSEKDKESLGAIVNKGRLTDSFYAAEEKNNCSGCQDAPESEHAVDYIFFGGGSGNFKVKSWYAPWGSPGPQTLTDHTVPRIEMEYDPRNVGSLLEIVKARGWTVRPISIRKVSEKFGLARPVNLRHI